jgi:hypothetical protein
MAWPLGLGGRNRKQSKNSAEDDISLQRLEAMTNVGYEEVPLPDEGELSEEESVLRSLRRHLTPLPLQEVEEVSLLVLIQKLSKEWCHHA